MSTKTETKKKPKTLEQVLNPIEIREVQPLIPLDVYRKLVKLGADNVPLMRINTYCAKVLIEHAEKYGSPSFVR